MTTQPALQESATPWTPAQLRFMLWLATPEKLREPRRQDDFARQLRVDPATLWRWKHLAGFGDEVLRLARGIVKSSDLAQILHAQVAKAKQGDTQAAKFVFESVGELRGEGADRRVQVLIVNEADAKGEVLNPFAD